MKVYSRLRRNTSQKKSLIRSLVSSLIIHERIYTTESKAKELKRIFDKVINLSKNNNLISKRRALLFIFNQKINDKQTVLQKLFEDLSQRYLDRNSGYTRIIKTEYRRGDSAPMAFISLV
ncbi:50S ribosomal protein L17 [Candidatus Phytoplasma sacchari]|uniref:Large ribosomal subunit protein bL17 n=1 Tax=Candidatus Phytoplasma sacchari TaxID=2609813 RepID=A0ABY7M1S9_9MOLU|nr:50S ribosomal protein L17 [Candidatus Phytoplasma sacchari]KAB8122838.1 50S ribosomal protein L17 [Candidatus Phytoplasma sacchari]WBL31242.1 50S ribosomal protein L17 [Candidatus Phytoplasma sacchari]